MTKKDKASLRQLFIKEAQGTLTSAEEQLLDEWYNSFDKTQREMVVFKNADHELQVRQKLLNRIIEAGFPEETPVRSINYRKRLRWFSAAAIFLMFVTGALVWKYAGNSHLQAETLLSTATGEGKIQKIILTDGTEIWLNAGSKLRYPQQFSAQHRDVYLEGEAFFDVAHDPSRPFSVHTKGLITHVLGTAFSVTAYKNMPTEAVTVMRGKVSVMHNRRVLCFITPDKHIEYNTQSGKSTLSDMSSSSAISWKDGKLQFENQNMQDIAGRLGRWYGYAFRFEHKNIQNCHYTASFNNQIPLKQLLKVMKAISLVNYKIDTTQKTVTFLGTGCNE
ncbi:FecR family protein [Mucilaginibacter sp. OK268]|uniref:FecR family protein n=1 Tax=Mucilaginibacter sp. OK268 TaxID=1881048 RepID=UPI000884CCCC|nr:FecR family protein [Mucilaginibacter sp. OK268]SDP07345.1 FecR family protein [Mucilaginibacter sp. OK268]